MAMRSRRRLRGIEQPMQPTAKNRLCAAALDWALLPTTWQSSRTLCTLRLPSCRRLAQSSLATRTNGFNKIIESVDTAALNAASLPKTRQSSRTLCTLRLPSFARLAPSSLATHTNGFNFRSPLRHSGESRNPVRYSLTARPRAHSPYSVN